MRHILQANYPEHAEKVQFFVGDVRNIDSVRDVMYGANYVFHVATLKEVLSCGFFPMEAVRTNIIGTDNVITAVVENEIERVVFLSADKAVYPVSSMGMTKAVGEKVVAARAQKAFERGGTVLSYTRYGNVICSRGSVILLSIDQIRRKAPITITDPNMTRFLMNLDETVVLVAYQGVSNKVEKLKSIVNDLSSVAYIGDDINDIPCMEAVKKAGGIVGCPRNAVDDVKKIASYVSVYDGGDGVVRDFIEFIIKQ